MLAGPLDAPDRCTGRRAGKRWSRRGAVHGAGDRNEWRRGATGRQEKAHLAVPVIGLALLAALWIVYHPATHGNDSTQKAVRCGWVYRLYRGEASGGYG